MTECTSTAIIYTKLNCPACIEAKTLLTHKNICIEERHLGTDVTIGDMYDHIGFPVRTVPQLFITTNNTERYIGGIVELREYAIDK